MSVRIAVIGAGVAGLAAAHRLRGALGREGRIDVVEAHGRPGGKLETVELAGHAFDVGAEAFLARRPEMPELLAELGLDDQLVHPAGRAPLLYAGGRLHGLPTPTLMGIPAGPESVAEVVGERTLATIADEASRTLDWSAGGDVSVADLVGGRFGAEVVARSVDPLLGGVYSGSAASLGVRAAIPALAQALDEGASSLTAAVRAALPAPRPGPVFGALRDGYRVLVDALVSACDAQLHLGVRATGLRRTDDGWWVDPLGSVDAVVVAVPTPAMAELLRPVSADGADAAAAIPVASSVVVALALPATARLPENSGVLVATGEALSAKAFTLSSRKWPHLRGEDGEQLVRVSFGRFGDAPGGVADADDDWLIARAAGDLATVLGTEIEPVATAVQRWPDGLPQYAPGHVALVSRLESAVAELPGLEVAGAALYGVGVPACVGAGRRAADRLVNVLGARG